MGDDFYLHRTAAPGRMYRSTGAEVEETIHQLEASDQWRLDLYGGSVDYDSTALDVTPPDGSRPYHLSEVDAHSGSNNGRTDSVGLGTSGPAVASSVLSPDDHAAVGEGDWQAA